MRRTTLLETGRAAQRWNCSMTCGVAVLTVAMLFSLLALGEEPEGSNSIGPTVCKVDLEVPEATRVVVDGRERGTTHHLTFRDLAPGKEYRSIIAIMLPRGAMAQRKVSVRGGTEVRLTLSEFLESADGRLPDAAPFETSRVRK